jgi:hypothetical protein
MGNMKVSSEHFAILNKIITPLNTNELREKYRWGDFPRAHLVEDLDKRYRWDLYWQAVRNGNSLPDSTDGYNDAHIDTALRKIVKPL